MGRSSFIVLPALVIRCVYWAGCFVFLLSLSLFYDIPIASFTLPSYFSSTSFLLPCYFPITSFHFSSHFLPLLSSPSTFRLCTCVVCASWCAVRAGFKVGAGYRMPSDHQSLMISIRLTAYVENVSWSQGFKHALKSWPSYA